jgi:hypothetical protein
MSLLTKDLIEKCKKYPLYSQDGKGGDATVIAHFIRYLVINMKIVLI